MEADHAEDQVDSSHAEALGLDGTLSSQVRHPGRWHGAQEWSPSSLSTSSLSFVSAWPFLEHLGDRLSLFLDRICLDRAVLLGEIPDSFWLLLLDRGLIKFSDLPPLKGSRDKARSEAPLSESLRPDRYLPPGCSIGDADSTLPFTLRANSSRALAWSWAEHLAARGQVSSWALAHILDKIFLESSTVAALRLAYANNPSRQQFSFAERCEISGCPELASSVCLDCSLDVSRAPRWNQGPRQRLALLAKSLRSIPSTTIPLEAWRF